MVKLNSILLVIVFLSAIWLITLRSQTRGYFDRTEYEKRLAHDLDAEYRLMQLEKARLTNITRVKKKADEIGMALPDYENRKVLR